MGFRGRFCVTAGAERLDPHLGEKNRFVVRGQVGWIETNDFDKVPPDLRFFAGGDRSIRGYKFQGISRVGMTAS